MIGTILILVGMGAFVGFGVSIMAIEIARKQTPLIYFSITERQNGMAGEILKVRRKTYKDGTKGFEAKKCVLDAGIGAIFTKWMPVNDIDPKLAMTKKSGGTAALTYSPCDNVQLPIKLEKNEQALTLIVQSIKVGNWYRGAVKKMFLLPLLNQKEGFWGKHPAAAVIMAGLIVFMLLIVGLIFIPQVATAHNAQLTEMIGTLSNSLSTLGVNVGAATSGANVLQ